MRASIYGLPAGFRTHVGIIGALDVMGTKMRGLQTMFVYPRKSGAHALGQNGVFGCGWFGTQLFCTAGVVQWSQDGIGVRSCWYGS